MLDLGGLIKPGSIVRMTESKPGGKTSHAVQLVRQVDNFVVCKIWHVISPVLSLLTICVLACAYAQSLADIIDLLDRIGFPSYV